MRILLLLVPILFVGCVTQPNYQQIYDTYAYQIDTKVQNGLIAPADGEALKLNYLNQVNAQASERQAYIRQGFQQAGNSFHHEKTRCTTRPDYNGGFYTDCN